MSFDIFFVITCAGRSNERGSAEGIGGLFGSLIFFVAFVSCLFICCLLFVADGNQAVKGPLRRCYET